MAITHICFECEGEKQYLITFEHGGPNYEPCNICNGKGVLEYVDEVQIKYFFPDYVLPQASESTESLSECGSRKGSGGSHE